MENGIVLQAHWFEREYNEKELLKDHSILLSNDFLTASDLCRIFVTTHSVRKLFNFIEWGKAESSFSDEQGGMIYGTRYLDPVLKKHWMIIRDVDPDYEAIATSASLRFKPNKRLQDDLNSEFEPGMEEYFYTLGWFHTHPNNLPVFMSSMDREIQHKFFPTDDYCAIVINPQKKIIKTFMSLDFKEIQTILLERR